VDGRLGFANSSTCALEFAEPGVVGGWGGSVLPIQALAHSNLQDQGEWLVGQRRVVDAQGESVLPIQALACLNLQNQEWWVDGETWFCQFKHLRARIC